MVLVNEATRIGAIGHEQASVLLRLVYPFAPHIACELWERMEFDGLLTDSKWPQFDPDKLKSDTEEIVVQVLGKVRSRISMAVDADEETIKAAALADENVLKHTGNKPVRRIIIVPHKLVNIVV